MSAKRSILTIASLAATIALGACQSKPVGVSPGAGDPVAAGDYPHVSVEPALSKFIAVSYDAIVATPPTGSTPLTVQVPIRSTAGNQYLIQHRFTWYDGNGLQTGQTAWTMLAMEPAMRRTIRANANDAMSERWLLEIRSSR